MRKLLEIVLSLATAALLLYAAMTAAKGIAGQRPPQVENEAGLAVPAPAQGCGACMQLARRES